MTLLILHNVTKKFGGLTAVDDVSLELAEGEILGLIGPNGAGKTTLFNLISGTFQLDHGEIFLNGSEITNMQPHQVAQRGLVRTFQIVKPFAELSVVENVMVGSFLENSQVRAAEHHARQVIDQVELSAFADQPAHSLTTAGRKRLELARALATQAKLLLLDEVMAGLTPSESTEMVKLIQNIRANGVTLLVIEHVMQALMSLSDRVAVLHHGQLISVGLPSEIASDKKVIEAYLGQEFEIAAN